MKDLDVINAPWLINEIQQRSKKEKKVVELLISNCIFTLEENFFGFEDRKIEVNFQFISKFPKEFNFQSQAKSILTIEGNIYFIFAFDQLKDESVQEIKKVAFHEAYHICQMDWLRRRAGKNMFWQVIKLINKKFGYNNPLEIGAYKFEKNPFIYKQNFSEAFGKYLYR